MAKTPPIFATPPAAAMPSFDGQESLDWLRDARMLDLPDHPGILGRIDRFEVHGLLGQGGMGVVLRAYDPVNNRWVAIKTLNPDGAAMPLIVRRFAREAKHMARMKHPNILPILECVDRPGSFYYVMPLIAGGCLSEQAERGRLTREMILGVAIQVAAAMVYAHDEAGVLHRDIKPQNILIDEHGTPLIADFGLVRSFGEGNETAVQSSSADPNWTVGTLCYMAPEVLAGKAGDTRADIYSFGATLYDVLSGQRPYQAKNTLQLIDLIRGGPPAALKALRPEIGEGWNTIVGGAMGRELRERYAHMADLLADLRRLQKGQPVLGPRGDGLPSGAPRPEPEEFLKRAKAAISSFFRGDSDSGDVPTTVRGPIPQTFPATYPDTLLPTPRPVIRRPRPRSRRRLKLVAALMLAVSAVGAGFASWPPPPPPPPMPPRPIPVPPSPVPVKPGPATAQAANQPATRPLRPIPDLRLQLDQCLCDGNDGGAIEAIADLSAQYGSLLPEDPYLAFTAVKFQRFLVLRFLAQNGYRFSEQDPSTRNSLLHAAVVANSPQAIEIIAKANPSLATQVNGEGNAPIHLAAADGKLAAIAALLQAPAGNVNEPNRYGDTPLHVAAQNGQVQTVRVLLSKGANPEIRNNKGQTPRDLAEDPQVQVLLR